MWLANSIIWERLLVSIHTVYWQGQTSEIHYMPMYLIVKWKIAKDKLKPTGWVGSHEDKLKPMSVLTASGLGGMSTTIGSWGSSSRCETHSWSRNCTSWKRIQEKAEQLQPWLLLHPKEMSQQINEQSVSCSTPAASLPSPNPISHKNISCGPS